MIQPEISEGLKYTELKKVALTFDDGPNPPFTNFLIDYLAENRIPATFFQVGENIMKFSGLTKKMADEGFRIANHTETHPLLKTAFGNILDQVEETEALIRQFAGSQQKIFRSPFGIAPPLFLRRLKNEGYHIAPTRTAVRAGDENAKVTSDKIVTRVLNKVRNGSVILLHDGDGVEGKRSRAETVDAVKILVPELEMRGFEIVDLMEILRRKNVGIVYP